MIAERPDWTEGFQRTAIAAALRGRLLARCGPAFRGSLFGPPTAPRARIGASIEEYWGRYRAVPTEGEIEERLAQGRMSEGEKRAVLDEWARVCGVPAPADEGYVAEQLQDWVERQGIIQTLLAAAERAPTESLETLRQFVVDGVQSSTVEVEKREWRLVGDGPARTALWRGGEEYGDPIPTGLAAFDAALGGGPRRGEVHYILAPPKGAKTTALTNIALGAVRRRFNVYLVTYEMRAHRILLRADRTLTRSSRDELRAEPERLDRALRGLTASGAGELWAWESSPQAQGACDEVRRRIEKLRQTGVEIDLVVLDYLNIMGASRAEREKRHELARISRDIAAMTRDLNVVTWCAALVKRDAVNKERVRKQDISESFEVVAVADGMTAICSTEEMREAGLASLFIAAMREEEDEREAGTYRVDRKRGVFLPFYERDSGDANKER